MPKLLLHVDHQKSQNPASEGVVSKKDGRHAAATAAQPATAPTDARQPKSMEAAEGEARF